MDHQLFWKSSSNYENQFVNETKRTRRYYIIFPLPNSNFLCLMLLTEYGDMTIGELSQKCCLACSTMTDLIDRMEKNQVVKRIRGERDRRIVNIHLLPRGEELIIQVMGKNTERRSRCGDDQQCGGTVAVVLFVFGVLVGMAVAGLIDGQHVKVPRQGTAMFLEKFDQTRSARPTAVQQHDRLLGLPTPAS